MDPYIIDFKFYGQFFVATEESREWYDPLKPYTELEYRWVLDHVRLENMVVADVGCHHGNYACLFWIKRPAVLTLVDVHQSNLDIARVNMALNNYDRLGCEYLRAAAAGLSGETVYDGLSNGHAGVGNKPVRAMRMVQIDAQAEVVKLDIEGSEFEIIPEQLDEMRFVKCWIVEVHPNYGDPNVIAQGLKDAGFNLKKVDRERMIVRDYTIGEAWQTHATLIGWRKGGLNR